MSEDNVWTPVPEWDVMMKATALSRTLLAGRSAMIEAGTDYLPRFPKETPQDGRDPYQDRLNSTFLHPGYARALRNHSARVHSEPIKIADDVPDTAREWLEDIDGRGNSLDAWAPSVFLAAEADGVTHILVDSDPLPPDATGADAQDAGIRPFFVHVPAERLIGWQYDWIGSRLELTQLRIVESHRQQKEGSEYQSVTLKRIRVITPTAWQIWQQTAEDSATYLPLPPEEGGEGTMPGFIPLVTVSFNPTGPMTGSPFLQDLAEKNLQHWQCDSDYQNHLKFAQLPMFTGNGIPKGHEPTAVGSSIAWFFEAADSTVQTVEFSGSAAATGKANVDGILDEMRELGLLPVLTKWAGAPTATEESLKAAQAQSDLQALSIKWGARLNEALRLAGLWQNVEIPPNALEPVRDFYSLINQDEIASLGRELQRLEELKTSATRSLLLDALKRHDLLPDETDAEEVEQEISDELAARPMPNFGPPVDDEEDEEETEPV